MNYSSTSPKLELDFVTTSPIEQCRARLTQPTLAGSHRVYLGENGRFTVEWGRRGTWPQSSDAGIILQFIGYLEPVKSGTRVHGAVTHDSRRVVDRVRQLTILAAFGTVMLFIMVVSDILSEITLFGIGGLVSAALGIYSVIVRRALAGLAPWVRDQLADLPPEAPDS